MYPKKNVDESIFLYCQPHIGFLGHVVNRVDEDCIKWIRGSNERDEHAAVGGHENKTSQAPNSGQQTNNQFTVTFYCAAYCTSYYQIYNSICF